MSNIHQSIEREGNTVDQNEETQAIYQDRSTKNQNKETVEIQKNNEPSQNEFTAPETSKEPENLEVQNFELN